MSIWEESGSFNLNLENWLISEEEIPSRYKLEMKYKSVSCCYKVSWKLRATKNIVYISCFPENISVFWKNDKQSNTNADLQGTGSTADSDFKP